MCICLGSYLRLVLRCWCWVIGVLLLALLSGLLALGESCQALTRLECFGDISFEQPQSTMWQRA